MARTPIAANGGALRAKNPHLKVATNIPPYVDGLSQSALLCCVEQNDGEYREVIPSGISGGKVRISFAFCNVRSPFCIFVSNLLGYFDGVIETFDRLGLFEYVSVALSEIAK